MPHCPLFVSIKMFSAPTPTFGKGEASQEGGLAPGSWRPCHGCTIWGFRVHRAPLRYGGARHEGDSPQSCHTWLALLPSLPVLPLAPLKLYRVPETAVLFPSDHEHVLSTTHGGSSLMQVCILLRALSSFLDSDIRKQMRLRANGSSPMGFESQAS